MAKKFTPEVLNLLIEYGPETGWLVWRERNEAFFTGENPESSAKRWNNRWAGLPALANVNGHGYLTGSILYKTVAAHRVAWAIFHGVWPKSQIDHINGIRTDNRIVNLRDVSRSENLRNCKISSINTSGATGVSWHARSSSWQAYIYDCGRQRCLGYFGTVSEAKAAREAANRLSGFHQNHGRNAE